MLFMPAMANTEEHLLEIFRAQAWISGGLFLLMGTWFWIPPTEGEGSLLISLPFLLIPPPFIGIPRLSFSFHRRSFSFHRLSSAFHLRSLPFHRLSFHRRSIPFHCLSLPFRRLCLKAGARFSLQGEAGKPGLTLTEELRLCCSGRAGLTVLTFGILVGVSLLLQVRGAP